MTEVKHIGTDTDPDGVNREEREETRRLTGDVTSVERIDWDWNQGIFNHGPSGRDQPLHETHEK